jgi:nucleotide-binding universal stress UspA family protein
MENPRKVLACVDQSHYANHVSDYAAWAARRMQAPLELLHVIDRHPEIASSTDHSGAIGLGAQTQLLQDLSEQDAARSKEAREQGRLFLNRLRERAITAGVAEPDVRQRLGDIESTLIEQQEAVRLFVLGRRGRSAEATQRDLGRNVERVVRALRKPILAVTDDFREPSRALFAFDGGSITRRGVRMLADSPLLRGIPIELLMSGKPDRNATRQLDWARETLEKAGHEATASLVPGDAERIIGQQVKEQEIDLLIMGAYSHSPLRSLLLGSKTSDLLRSATVPTLLLR